MLFACANYTTDLSKFSVNNLFSSVTVQNTVKWLVLSQGDSE